MDENILAYSFIQCSRPGMFQSKETEPAIAMCKNMDELQKYNAEQKSQLQKSRWCMLPFTETKAGKK